MQCRKNTFPLFPVLMRNTITNIRCYAREKTTHTFKIICTKTINKARHLKDSKFHYLEHLNIRQEWLIQL